MKADHAERARNALLVRIADPMTSTGSIKACAEALSKLPPAPVDLGHGYAEQWKAVAVAGQSPESDTTC